MVGPGGSHALQSYPGTTCPTRRPLKIMNDENFTDGSNQSYNASTRAAGSSRNQLSSAITNGSTPKSRSVAVRSASMYEWKKFVCEYHSAPPCHMKTTGRPPMVSRLLAGIVSKNRF